MYSMDGTRVFTSGGELTAPSCLGSGHQLTDSPAWSGRDRGGGEGGGAGYAGVCVCVHYSREPTHTHAICAHLLKLQTGLRRLPTSLLFVVGLKKRCRCASVITAHALPLCAVWHCSEHCRAVLQRNRLLQSSLLLLGGGEGGRNRDTICRVTLL